MLAPPTLDREVVERALPWHLQASLPDLCRLFNISCEDWQDHPILADFLTIAAAVALRDRGVRKGLSRTRALEVGCTELGASYGAVRKRLHRAAKAYSALGGVGDVLSLEREKRAVRFKDTPLRGATK